MSFIKKMPSWITQPICQIVLFITSYSLLWELIRKMGYIKTDVSWGILMEYIFIFFIILSVFMGVSKYFKLLSPLKLSVLFTILFLCVSGFFLSYSFYRLGIIWVLATFSTVIAHLLSNQKE